MKALKLFGCCLVTALGMVLFIYGVLFLTVIQNERSQPATMTAVGAIIAAGGLYLLKKQ